MTISMLADDKDRGKGGKGYSGREAGQPRSGISWRVEERSGRGRL